MSNLQYGTLKYIITHDVQVEHLRVINQMTLGSLLVRGWIERSGTKIQATKNGIKAYDMYRLADVNMRKREADLSDRVGVLLHIRSLSVMKKVG